MWTPSRKRILTVIIGLVGLATVFHLLSRPSAEAVMADFYSSDSVEEMLMDPLILNADIVAPHVIVEIQNKDMPRRRYAIGFLGNEKVESTLPVLRSILNDSTELDVFRADALESIYQIDHVEGKHQAQNFSARQDHLGYIARGLLDGSHVPFQRSKWQARIGHKE